MLVLQAPDINALAVSELSFVGPGFFCAVIVRVKFEYAVKIGINAAGGNNAHVVR